MYDGVVLNFPPFLLRTLTRSIWLANWFVVCVLKMCCHNCQWQTSKLQKPCIRWVSRFAPCLVKWLAKWNKFLMFIICCIKAFAFKARRRECKLFLLFVTVMCQDCNFLWSANLSLKEHYSPRLHPMNDSAFWTLNSVWVHDTELFWLLSNLNSNYADEKWQKACMCVFLHGRFSSLYFTTGLYSINYSLQAIFSARADATYKHGLDPDRLLVGKGCIGSIVSFDFLYFVKSSALLIMKFLLINSWGIYWKRICGIQQEETGLPW